MTTLLVPVRDLELAKQAERRADFARSGKADGTWKVYDGAWARFAAWLLARGALDAPPVRPELVADYAIHLFEGGKSGSTIRVAVAAIGHKHALAGVPSPILSAELGEVLSGIYRRAGKEARGRGPSDPLLPDDLRRMVARLQPGLRGARDLCLLTFGFAGGFRRAELCRLAVEDLTFEPDGGVMVRLRWSKRDQQGEGHTRRIAPGNHPELCPVSNLRLWLSAAGITSGPIFRAVIKNIVQPGALCDRSIDRIVRDVVKRVLKSGAELTGVHYSAHSLRSGLCTAAAIAGKPQWEIGEHVDHKSPQTTARYIRTAKVMKSTLTKDIGL